jgi:ATP-dependent helicase HrpB
VASGHQYIPAVRLPIDDVLPSLRTALAERPSAVLQAPPGAGKTTRVPLALLDAAWLAGQRIIMLEPRRVAARAAAAFMARTLGEAPGGVVGYRTRLDTRVGPRTRVEVVTEGILTRMLAGDAALEPYGLVIFDEFHERSLHADAGLALTLESQSVLRPELRILVMSATLDGQRVADLLGGAPIVTSQGISHPVDTTYLPRAPGSRLEVEVARAVHRALEETTGDVLVFLPGVGEIARVETALGRRGSQDGEGGGGRTRAHEGGAFGVIPLHGTLSPEAQDRALKPDLHGRRKVILATSIAETSLTIDGVRVVVDAGLARVPQYSARTGLTRLATVRASRASTEQRAGRAGRQAPGWCYRLWAEHEQAGLVPFAAPEITEADLAPLLLSLSAAGAPDPFALRWLDAPPAGHVAEAGLLLSELGLRDTSGALTPHGMAAARLGLHPRLAHMVLSAHELGATAAAAMLAALLEERDILRSAPEVHDPDVRLRVELLRGQRVPPVWHGMTVARESVERVRRHAREIGRAERAEGTEKMESGDVGSLAGLLAATAFPDRVAWRRPGTNRFLLRNGRGAVLTPPHALADAEFIVALDLDDRGAEGRIFLAAPLERSDVERAFSTALVTQDSVTIEEDGAIRTRREQRLGAILLAAHFVREPDPVAIARAIIAHESRSGLRSLVANDGFVRLRQRLAFLHALDDTWPDESDATILAQLEPWLPLHLPRPARLADLTRADLAGMLLDVLDWRQRRALEELAPTHYQVPRGARIAIDYADPSAPVLAVKLQEMFGVTRTPAVGGGRVPLTLHLLSPARRPVQVTSDLAGFWRGSYADVRKDLRGRYPKHGWPENPEKGEGRSEKG